MGNVLGWLASTDVEMNVDAVSAPVTEAISEPVPDAVSEPVPEAVSVPLTEAVSEPMTEAVSEPVPEAVVVAGAVRGAEPRKTLPKEEQPACTGDGNCDAPSCQQRHEHCGTEWQSCDNTTRGCGVCPTCGYYG